MLAVDNDHIHPVLGAANSSMAVILTQLGESYFGEARQCFREANKQFRLIYKRCLNDETTHREIISKQNFSSVCFHMYVFVSVPC